LVTLGLAPTRAKAQAMVLAGTVYLGDQRVDKSGTLIDEHAPLTVRGSANPYVSRGGLKLAGALETFHLDVTGKRCLDLGASTGGFTDCLLQRGAAHVAAVDVGYGQLAHKLRTDPRVLVLERTNARSLTPEAIGGAADLTVVDASFIGLGKLLDAIARCTREGGELLALVKPQFEVGREIASRGKGVIRDAGTRRSAIDGVVAETRNEGFTILGECDSTVPGPKGNVEAFLWARRTAAAC
jgi:23S rRNA (cytidine1920-2'-O)/16S rRNA (cytidine1409-2'-O)-methyltransferase